MDATSGAACELILDAFGVAVGADREKDHLAALSLGDRRTSSHAYSSYGLTEYLTLEVADFAAGDSDGRSSRAVFNKHGNFHGMPRLDGDRL